MSEDESDADRAFLERLGRLGPALLAALQALETARRQLHPPRLDEIRAALEPIHARLRAALDEFRAGEVPEPGMPIAEHKDWCSILRGQQEMARKAQAQQTSQA